MRKWGLFISIVSCILFMFTLAGCKKPDISSGLNIPTALPTNVPTASPSVTLPAATGEAEEETLDDLSSFKLLRDCYLDYTFQVEDLGSENDRTAYMVTGNYDLNSDGKEDSISILQKGRYNNLSYIEINQTKLTFDVDNPMDGEVHIIDLDKNDPYLEVISFDDGPSGDPVYMTFRYDGSSIIVLGEIGAGASIDGEGRLIPYFNRNNYFEPEFCSAWFEIMDNTLVYKNNSIDQYLGQRYDFSGGDAYFIPYDILPEQPDIRWEEMKHFEPCKIKLIDIWGMSEYDRLLNFYYIELPTGERGLLYFWMGD